MGNANVDLARKPKKREDPWKIINWTSWKYVWGCRMDPNDNIFLLSCDIVWTR
jgi:hypothetical protein